ncbi:hypothetical protein sscle_01g002970 [Sclerotinia sclerotiorum 1980 UF-70]|uniref:Uncharacterized protein n=1 Tax=Sclerotinia sclerotiorum (strain ATCC 18683 / 1980 / Ss-1) TaxID=665079 RepID=A0A1D9PS56_SCLS1|nr:hypothetical protein sscle_01g002970 [Sclerotinia sclerotiorum 1980 UF-70]
MLSSNASTPWNLRKYAVAPMHDVMRLPDGIRFEEPTAIPLAATTEMLYFFRRQYLPPAWSRCSDHSLLPLIVYEASSLLVRSQILARASNIHPIVAIAGSSPSHLESLLDPSSYDKLIDYRSGTEQWSKLPN